MLGWEGSHRDSPGTRVWRGDAGSQFREQEDRLRMERPGITGREQGLDKQMDKWTGSKMRVGGGKLAHQRSSPCAWLWGGCCRVHVAEESLNLPQGDTSTSVTHLGETGHARGYPDLVSTPHPNTSDLIASQSPGSFCTQSQRSCTLIDRSSSPKATMTFIGGSTRLDSWLSTVARMAFCRERRSEKADP